MSNNEDESNDSLPNLSSVSSQSTQNDTSTAAAARRKAAYAGRSGRELSTSAAKRQSIMALGSIRHLQHMYAKNGLAASTAPQIGNSGRVLPLAIPGRFMARHHRDGNDAAGGKYNDDDNADNHDTFLETPEDLPPSPSPPAPSAKKSFQVQVPSLRAQKQDVYRQVAEVCEKWGLVEMGKSLSSRRESSMGMNTINDLDVRSVMSPSPMPSEDSGENLILVLLNTTTSAIRSVQRYFLSLPPEKLPYTGQSQDAGRDNTSLRPPASTSRGLPTLGVVTASRPIPRHSMVGIATSSKRSLSPPSDSRTPTSTSHYIDSGQDPSVRLRKASLATLGALKEMEVRYRLARQEEGDASGLLSESLQDVSISNSSSDAPALTFNIEDTSASERSGSSDHARGHLYRDDISLQELAAEAQTVREWIEVVDFLMSAPTVAASTPRLRTQSGNLAPREEAIPAWAKKDTLDQKERLRHCLRSHLPAEIISNVPSNGSIDELLLTLSDGQLLCIAYNVLLRKSQRPWGFIPSHSIHDVISLVRQREAEKASGTSASNVETASVGDSLRPQSVLMRRMSSEGLSNDGTTSKEGSQRIGLTFRRLENLRLFVAALKLRYLLLLPLIDLKSIARKDDGWQAMLEQIAYGWLDAATEEKLNEEPESD